MKTAAALLCLCLAGCVTPQPAEQTQFLHTGSKAQAEKLAFEWFKAAPGRAWSTAGFTGSMIPTLYGGEFLLLEPSNSANTRPGSLVIFDRGDSPNVLHRVKRIKNGQALIRGDNTRRSDGWFPTSSIRWVVIQVVTFPQ